jgi:hypothetical protein
MSAELGASVPARGTGSPSVRRSSHRRATRLERGYSLVAAAIAAAIFVLTMSGMLSHAVTAVLVSTIEADRVMVRMAAADLARQTVSVGDGQDTVLVFAEGGVVAWDGGEPPHGARLVSRVWHAETSVATELIEITVTATLLNSASYEPEAGARQCMETITRTTVGLAS